MNMENEIEQAAKIARAEHLKNGKIFDETSFKDGAIWAYNHPAEEFIKEIAEQILMYNQITPDCWCQWIGDGLIRYIKENSKNKLL